MKKLFLCIAFFVLVFLLSKEVAQKVYKEYNTDSNTTEEITLQTDITEVYTTTEAMVVPEKSRYIVGIRNGYVIVYENTTDNIFEYTDIDAELIKIINPTLYQELNDSIMLNSTEEIYKFLESISS